MAASPAHTPASAKASPTSRATGSPTRTAASKSCAIASSARPKRVRCRSVAPSPASTSATAATKAERTWTVAPPTCQKPSSAMCLNGSGSGKTYAGRSKNTTSSVRIAKATASDAPTQPITDPRARYGSIARKYEPALAAAVTSIPTTSASRNRAPPTLVCDTGPEPAATKSVTNTPSAISSAKAKWTTPVRRKTSDCPTATSPYTAPAANPVARICNATATIRHSRLARMTLRLSSAGESHGPALVAIVTGLPAGLELDRDSVDTDLARRQAGYGRSPRQQIEQDRVDVLAGLRHGRTLGTPLALVVRNVDHKNWTWGMSPWPPEGDPAGKGTAAVTLPRPGHADLAGVLKYGHDDVRNALERASARHTAVHVAAGSVAKGLLASIGIAVHGSTVDEKAFRARTDEARKERDTVGGVIEVRAVGVPPGLGSYAAKEDRLDARLAFALMGIQAVKGVEIGDGFALAGLRGSQAHDEIRTDRRRDTNHAGGIEAGVSNGEEIVVRAAMKPLPTLMKPLASVDLATGEEATALVERSDVAAVEALAVVAEAAVAWELAVLALDKFGGDAVEDFVAAYTAYIRRIAWR